VDVWLTKGSDIEAYWTKKKVVREHFSISNDQAISLVKEAMGELGKDAKRTFNKKRSDVVNALKEIQQGEVEITGTAEARKDCKARFGREGLYVGKDLCAKIRKLAKDKKYDRVNSFGKVVPNGCTVAEDLLQLLNA